MRDGTHDSPKYFEKGYPLVTSKNLKSYGLDLSDASFISNEDFELINNRSKVDIGDILFGMIGTIGNPVLVERNDFAIKNVALIKENKSTSNHFLIQLLKSPIFDRYIANENAGGTQKFLALNKIRCFKFLSPNKNEQNKISNFFKRLDETITLQERELELLKLTKKSFLQQLFAVNEEKYPNLRFVNFYGEWEQRKLLDNTKDVLDYRGKSPSKFDMTWGETGYLVLSALNVKDGYIDKTIDAKYGDKTLFIQWMGTRRLEKDDVIFTTEAPLGNVAQVPDDDGYILNQRAVAFKIDEKKSDNNFFAQLLRSPLVQSKFYANSSGGTAKGIGMKEFDKLKSLVPKKVEESITIGKFLKNIDKSITLQEKKLVKLKETKKSFLQKMFI